MKPLLFRAAIGLFLSIWISSFALAQEPTTRLLPDVWLCTDENGNKEYKNTGAVKGCKKVYLLNPSPNHGNKTGVQPNWEAGEAFLKSLEATKKPKPAYAQQNNSDADPLNLSALEPVASYNAQQEAQKAAEQPITSQELPEGVRARFEIQPSRISDPKESRLKRD